ncbi:unnamed protein product [Ranitomeya imitator]|uniref:Helix-turn-helix domain-containing protein n=1 Tax=Ranitomeya imitator TaxID=111125 RepID=A0ABN9LTX4_9NEOB|nr:unnamed protein product [Ranitomeya imitator]
MKADVSPVFAAQANLFLGAWERDIFLSNPVVHIDKVHHWIRYIDDVFFVWEGTVEQLHQFISTLNGNELNIKLTFTYGGKINFLDLDICVSSQGLIETDVYRKPTATNTLLHTSSSHRQSTIDGIPIGQHLRVKRICSTQEKYDHQASDLYHRFRDWGYSHSQIRRGYKRACQKSRNKRLYQTTSKKKDTQFLFIHIYMDLSLNYVTDHYAFLCENCLEDNFLNSWTSLAYASLRRIFIFYISNNIVTSH